MLSVQGVATLGLLPALPRMVIWKPSLFFQLLALQGVTIFVAAGDSGVHDRAAGNDASKCGYSPLWPASSPWVPSIN